MTELTTLEIAILRTTDYLFGEQSKGFLYAITEREAMDYVMPHLLALADLTTMLRSLVVDRVQTWYSGDLDVSVAEHRLGKVVPPDLLALIVMARHDVEPEEQGPWWRPGPGFSLDVLTDGEAPGGFARKIRPSTRNLSVLEYFLIDPSEKRAAFQGFRAGDQADSAIAPNEIGRMWSESLQAWLGRDTDGGARLWNAAGRPQPRLDELTTRHR